MLTSTQVLNLIATENVQAALLEALGGTLRQAAQDPRASSWRTSTAISAHIRALRAELRRLESWQRR